MRRTIGWSGEARSGTCERGRVHTGRTALRRPNVWLAAMYGWRPCTALAAMYGFGGLGTALGHVRMAALYGSRPCTEAMYGFGGLGHQNGGGGGGGGESSRCEQGPPTRGAS